MTSQSPVPSERTPLKRTATETSGSSDVLDSRSGTNMSAMTVHGHKEEHATGAQLIRDAIIGLSDGLTVPFALAAGLSSLNDTKLVIAAGLAELVAGAISMGLGGFLAGKSEIEHYDSERRREYQELVDVPEEEEQEIVDIFEPYGLTRSDIEPLLTRLRADPDKFVDFMMQFELQLDKPNEYQSFISGATVGLSYFIGGLVPLLPYFFLTSTQTALYASVPTTLLALFIFGVFKAKAVGETAVFKSAVQTIMIGAVAAAASFLLVRVFNN